MTRVSENGPDIALRVLSELEKADCGDTGALIFGSEEQISGVVLVEQRRVCWAAAQGLRQRLTDMLRMCCKSPLEPDDMEKLFLQCKELRKPIGERLVELALVEPEALRSVLLHHTAESLCAEDCWRGNPRWVPHRARGYLSAYTYTPAEVLSYASALACGQEAVDAATRKLEDFARERDAAAFDVSGTTLLSCRLLSASPVGLRGLRHAGRWAALSCAESGEGRSVLKFVLDGQGGTWLSWRDDRVTYLVHCPDLPVFSEMLRVMHHRGFTSAVQSSLPFTDARALLG